MKPIHDRVTVEVARGCIRGCRFCQAGIIYRPYRERRPETVKDLLHGSLACTGYEELSLASLSTGDYSDIEPLITGLMKTYKDSRVSVSLPSLRVGTLTPAMIEAIAGTRKTGFTLAPEAGTERLRRVINKPVTDMDLMDAAETIFANGWSTLKLYFMIGLPTETDEDLDGIIRLANELFARGRRSSKRHVQLNVSVSTFVPKPHTPFQWLGQAPIEEVRRKQAYLAQRLRKRGIVLKVHDPETSQLESAFARGDASLGRVIEKAVDLGCRFDGWTESFDYQKWTEAFAACGIDLRSLCRQDVRSFGSAALGPHQERRDHGISPKGIPARHGGNGHGELPDRVRTLRHRVQGRRNARARQACCTCPRRTRGCSAACGEAVLCPSGDHNAHQDEVLSPRPHPLSVPSRLHDPVPPDNGPRRSARRLLPGLQPPPEDSIRSCPVRGHGERGRVPRYGDRSIH